MGDGESGDRVATPASFRRHTLLWVDPGAWDVILDERPDLADVPLLRDWARRSRPLIARRRAPCDRADHVPVGLPLPPAQGKTRLVFELPPRAIESVAPPPCLADIRASCPETWRSTIDAIVDLGHDIGAQPRVFGSFAWAALTGLDFISPTSDLDLLWPLTDAIDREALLEGLARLERTAPGRLDGELVRARDGVAVNWRELHQSAQMILVKTKESVVLKPTQWFYAPRAMVHE